MLRERMADERATESQKRERKRERETGDAGTGTPIRRRDQNGSLRRGRRADGGERGAAGGPGSGPTPGVDFN